MKDKQSIDLFYSIVIILLCMYTALWPWNTIFGIFQSDLDYVTPIYFQTILNKNTVQTRGSKLLIFNSEFAQYISF